MRQTESIIEFSEKGTFESVYAANRWCKENGYSYGSMCGQQPIALLKGDYNIAQKWKNLTNKEREAVDGIMTSNDFREGKVKIILYKPLHNSEQGAKVSDTTNDAM